MTTVELTLALSVLEARVANLEQQVEITRDLLSRCLVIPLPQALPGQPDLPTGPSGLTEPGTDRTRN